MQKLKEALHNGFSQLGSPFCVQQSPQTVSNPKLVLFNQALAKQCDLLLEDDELVSLLAGNISPSHSTAVATAYAGHQFGQFSPSLGDGRALLLGDVASVDGQPYEMQLKGSGPTQFARRGDGRSALAPALREYVVSEAMYALGVSTTRALAVVETGDVVMRQEPERGGITTRLARSHLRIGSFEYFAAQQDIESLQKLLDFAIARLDADLIGVKGSSLAFLQRVVTRQAHLIAHWMSLGFVHGVMNTDNMSLSGETIDYGPCAFIDRYRSMAVFSSIDVKGRYAFWNQPSIGLWNLNRLADSLMPLIQQDSVDGINEVNAVLASYHEVFSQAYLGHMRHKIGLTQAATNDAELITDLLNLMEEEKVDYTVFFRTLVQRLEAADNGAFASWITRWRERIKKENRDLSLIIHDMNSVNPVYIPRNHLVEKALREALHASDYAPIQTLIAVLNNPFSEQIGMEEYASPPTIENLSYRTFCGT